MAGLLSVLNWAEHDPANLRTPHFHNIYRTPIEGQMTEN